MLSNLPLRSLCIFLLAMSLLALEIALTRIFSVIMFYHFTYLVISVAMLGFGAAGTYLTIRKKDNDAGIEDEFLARNAWLLGLSVILAILIIPRIHFYAEDILIFQDYSIMISYLTIVFLTGAPFFFGGTFIAYVISQANKDINLIYFADLTGAAVGSLMALVLINYIGGVATFFAVAALAMIVAIIASRRMHRRAFIALSATIIITILTACFPKVLPLYVSPLKQMFRKEYLVELTKWHVITRLDVTQPIKILLSFGGALSFAYKEEPPNIRVIYQDGSALTGIIQPTPTIKETTSLGYYLQGAPYRIKPGADSLIIGCGGGVDILIALYQDARHVVGVDINPNMIELLQRYKAFAGNVYQRNDVDLVVSEGRLFLSRNQNKFDIIQLSGVDTGAAQSMGAFALTENYMYTAEAFDQYLADLKEDGIINISRPLYTPPHETLKLIVTSIEALERLGKNNPHMHLMILAGKGRGAILPWAQTLVKFSPFTRNEVNTVQRWTESLGFDVLYDPYTVRESEIQTLIHATAEERAKLVRQHFLNIAPATDDKPFFFEYYRWNNLLKKRIGIVRPMALFILLGTLISVTVLSALFIIYPLYRRGEMLPNRSDCWGIFTYFASLGLGFIFVEMTLLQKFMILLGGPAYSMAFTLFTILLTSGIGSFLSKHISERPLRLLAIIIPLLAFTIIVESFVMTMIITKLMNESYLLRSVIVILMVSPIGLLMGMPFPAGLRQVNDHFPELNPWAWGINACATVMGSVLCIVISISLGFQVTLMLSAFIYLTGWLLFTYSQRKHRIMPLLQSDLS